MLTLLGRRPQPEAPSSQTEHQPAAAPSPLLTHLAGEFAEEIAAVWPAPHGPFLLTEAGRRHLVCLAIALGCNADLRPGPAHLKAALDGPFRRTVRALLPRSPDGLARALSHLGEALWSAADYRLLYERLGEDFAGKRLRHADGISVEAVRTLSALPAQLLLAGGALLDLTGDQARLIGRCYEGLVVRDGAEAAARTARRWSRAKSTRSLLDLAGNDLVAQHTATFHEGTERLRPITSRKALDELALRYRNCLRSYDLGEGEHFFEWLGPPGVALCIVRDPLWGWSLQEAKLADNATPPVEVQAAIAAELAAIGVFVGPTRNTLRWRLNRASGDGFTYTEQEARHGDAFD